MSDEQDAADVGRVLVGDVEAFEGIVLRWQEALVTLAFRYCRDRHRSEEMAQSAFVKAYLALRQWRGEGPFRRWLFVIAANVYRSEMRRNRLFMLPLDAARDACQKTSDIERGEVEERKEIVRRAVTRLPEKYRDVLVLFYFHEKDVLETAQSLGVAEGTIKARLHRGRALLERALHRIKDE